MKQFLYQIKGKKSGEYSDGFTWVFPPLWTDVIDAKSREEAKEIIEQEYGRKFPLRVLKKDLDNNEFLLVIKEIKNDDIHTKSLFVNNICKQCGHQFKQIEKYQLGNKGGGFDFCSSECSDEHKRLNALQSFDSEIFTRQRIPVIYKITKKSNGLCYIGKTNQIFTLRWYQHFYHGSVTKFHTEIKNSKLTDWIFEVIETVDIPDDLKNMQDVHDFILKREMFYIKQYDSINNGYNSVSSKNELIEEEDLQIDLFEPHETLVIPS